MSGVIDTNLLLYAANADCAEHAVAREFLASLENRRGTCYLTGGICYEFLRVSTHLRVFPQPLTASQALDFLEILLAGERLQLLAAGGRHWQYLRQVLATLKHPAGNLFFDIRTATLMREAGIRTIYTADTDFLQFPDLEVIDPVHPAPSPGN